jgi:hypothetical protein
MGIIGMEAFFVIPPPWEESSVIVSFLLKH